MASSTAPANPPASLLTIPCELRNAIYYYVFCTDSVTDATPHLETGESNDIVKALHLANHTQNVVNKAAQQPDQKTNNLALLLTCNRINAEAHALALHHTPFHLSGTHAEPLCFASIAAPLLATNKLPALRHLTLQAKISHLRALNERWNGLPFGHSELHLHTLTLIPRKPECHASAYAEVADLSQSHTLAYIVAETAKTLRQVKCLVVRNEGCFSEVVWRLVYRSLVYRIWRWAGPRAGLRFECSGEEAEEGTEWLRVWIGEDDEVGGACVGGDAREVGEEVVRLVGGKGEARSVDDIPGL